MEITFYSHICSIVEFMYSKLFVFLILKGAQAGLSWSTILKKRANYQKAFDTLFI